MCSVASLLCGACASDTHGCSSVLFPAQVSLYQNCQPPRRSGRAAQMQTIFIALLFVPSFVGAFSMVAYTVWRYAILGELKLGCVCERKTCRDPCKISLVADCWVAQGIG